MKKSKFLVAGIATLGVLALASCGDNSSKGRDYSSLTDDASKNVSLNLDVQYAGSAGISNRTDTYTDIDGVNIDKDSLLPMWREIEKIFNVTIKDGSHKQASY